MVTISGSSKSISKRGRDPKYPIAPTTTPRTTARNTPVRAAIAASSSRRAPTDCETRAVTPETRMSPTAYRVQLAKKHVETAAIASGPSRPTQAVSAVP